MRQSLMLTVLVVFAFLTDVQQVQAGRKQDPSLRPSASSEHPESGANFVHGTIVVVISTKDGFVLAGDTRGSSSDCASLPGEYEKLFSYGKRSAIVVAGLIGSSDQTGELREAVATQLHFFNDQVSKASVQPQATTTIRTFSEAVERELSMFDTDVDPDRLISAASSVSLSENGVPEWVTVRFVPVIRTYRGGKKGWRIKLYDFVEPPQSRVLSLGAADDLVHRLIDLNAPDPNEPTSQKEVMKRYYSLKQQNKLSELTLADGTALAQLLIEYAIDFASTHPYPSYPCRGIGGSIDMLTVTSRGVEWLRPPDISKRAAIPPVYHARVINSDINGKLDGLEVLRGTIPVNATLTFSGLGEVRMVQPKFAGACTFILDNDAEERMPSTAATLKTVLGHSCDVYRQTKTGRVKLSTAEAVIHPPPSTNQFASMCTAELRAKALAFVAQLRNLVTTNAAVERQHSEEEWGAKQRMHTREDANVLGLKYGYQQIDRDNEYSSNYEANFVPMADALKHEMVKRVSPPVETGSEAGQKGTTPWEIYDVANDLEKLAHQLADDTCRPPQLQTTAK